MDEHKVVDFKQAKQRRRNHTSPRQPAPRQSTTRSAWGSKVWHVVQVVLFLVVLSFLVRLCHGGSIL